MKGMCGRLFQVSSPEDLKRWFGTSNLPNLPPRYNVAPTQDVAAVRWNPRTGERSLDLLRWGLVPHWAKDVRGAAKLINAQAETVATKPAFRDAFARRRCLIPADGFFEWRRSATEKEPHVIRMKGGALLAFAGLWANWRQPDGTWLRSCTILTTNANALCVPLHDRMPVIVAPEDYALWLGEREGDAAALMRLLVPFPAEGMESYRVGSEIGNVRNDTPSLIAPVAA
jgi:putative SOS response-associated peptidase YedK